jgi:hypothetical protein
MREAEKMGGKSELFTLRDRNIKMCDGCLVCEKTNACHIRDKIKGKRFASVVVGQVNSHKFVIINSHKFVIINSHKFVLKYEGTEKIIRFH